MGKLIDGGSWFKSRAPVSSTFEDSEFRDRVLETLDEFEARCDRRLKFTSVSSTVEPIDGYACVTTCARVLVPA